MIDRQQLLTIRSLVALTFAIVTLSVIVILYSPAVSANTANTLKVSPVRSDIDIKAGESRKVQTTITNLTDDPINVKPVLNDFVAGDEDGTPALLLEESEFASTRSLKRFMSPLDIVTIPPREARTVEVTISVPADAQAGGYFGAVRFASTDPDNGGQVNLSASVASLILLKVPGDLQEKLELASFDIRQGGKTGDRFGSPDNLQIAARFTNKGNVQVAPFGKISVMQGDNVVYEADFNTKQPRDMVLPDSARRWELPLEKIGSFGHYTVTATFTYGEQNQTLEISKSFWVIPTALVIGLIVGLLLLLLVILAIWWLLRGYKNRVLRRQGKANLRRRR